ncbi:hypothetical protein HCUR_00559 [Holospora curviuscula]|uniref:Uncharacterized protein n=1 Tax=Holospora curviuscula TaxID=1082868 RepID=A0A2S5R9M5_9PROT|nr:hypothetical protein HCUR_00559 [Holospora curviuscula]
MGQVGNRINRDFSCPWRMLPKDFPPYSTLHSLLVKVKIRAIAGLIHTVSKLPGLVNNAALTGGKKRDVNAIVLWIHKVISCMVLFMTLITIRGYNIF